MTYEQLVEKAFTIAKQRKVAFKAKFGMLVHHSVCIQHNSQQIFSLESGAGALWEKIGEELRKRDLFFEVYAFDAQEAQAVLSTKELTIDDLREYDTLDSDIWEMEQQDLTVEEKMETAEKYLNGELL